MQNQDSEVRNHSQFQCKKSRNFDLWIDAYLVSCGYHNKPALHYPKLGSFHYLSLNSISEFAKVMLLPNFTFHDEDFKRELRLVNKKYSKGDHMLIEKISIEHKIQSHQAETFISLILETKRCAISSSNLSAPALFALQMLLSSDWKPSLQIFPAEFIRILVSFLEDNDQLSSKQLKVDDAFLKTSSSCKSVAEDILSIILTKFNDNIDDLVSVIFDAFRSNDFLLMTSAKLAIISQALASHISRSLTSLVNQKIMKAEQIIQTEKLKESLLEVDTKWRASLSLGDSLEYGMASSRSRVSDYNDGFNNIPVMQDSENNEFIINWVKGVIVNIDRKADVLTIEILQTVVEDGPSDNLITKSTGTGSMQKKKQRLTSKKEMSTTNTPIGKSDTNSSFLVGATRDSRQLRPINTVIPTTKSTDSLRSMPSMMSPSNIISEQDEKFSNITNKLSFSVGKHHNLIVNLIFKSMDDSLNTTMGDRKKSYNRKAPFVKCSDSSNNLKLQSKIKHRNSKLKIPKCMFNHQMSVTNLEYVIQHRMKNLGFFCCNQCCVAPIYNRINKPRGWYCDPCGFHVCFHCHPEPLKSTKFLVLTRTVPDLNDLLGVDHSNHTLLPLLSTSVRTSQPITFTEGSVIEVNDPLSVSSNAFSALPSSFQSTSRDIKLSMQYYRLSDATGFVDQHPKDGWQWQITELEEKVDDSEIKENSSTSSESHSDPTTANGARCLLDLIEYGILLDNARKEEILNSDATGKGSLPLSPVADPANAVKQAGGVNQPLVRSSQEILQCFLKIALTLFQMVNDFLSKNTLSNKF